MKNITLIFIGFFCITSFLNAQNTNVKTYFDDHFVGGLANDGQTIWVGVDDLLVKMDKTTGETISWTLPISSVYNYPDRYASSISLDNNGLLWITSPSGVAGYGLEGNYFVTFSEEEGWIEIPWPNLFYANLIIDEEDKVWVSEITGLHEYDGTGWIDHITTSAQWPYFTTTFAVDNQNNKWLGLTYASYYPGILEGYLAKFEGSQTNVLTSQHLGGNGGSIWSMAVSTLGTVWMGTIGNGLVKFDGTNWQAYNWSNSELPNNNVRNIAVDGSNIVWLSTVNELTSITYGLTRFDGATWETFNTENSILPSNKINSIFIEENGTKWVGTDNGLISFTGNSLSTSNEQYSGVQFKLFPNPANDFIILKMPLEVLGSTVEVYNILGKSLKSFRAFENNIRLDVSSFSNGLYFIRLQTPNGMAIKKFVKQN